MGIVICKKNYKRIIIFNLNDHTQISDTTTHAKYCLWHILDSTSSSPFLVSHYQWTSVKMLTEKWVFNTAVQCNSIFQFKCHCKKTESRRQLLVRLSNKMFLVSIIDKDSIHIDIKFCQVFLKLRLPHHILLCLATFPSTWNGSRQARVVLVILLLTIFRRRNKIKNKFLDAFITFIVFQAEQQLNIAHIVTHWTCWTRTLSELLTVIPVPRHKQTRIARQIF